MQGLPTRSPSRTQEGGMGYTDAYGNTVSPEHREEKKAINRLRGAGDNASKKQEASGGSVLPMENRPPLWSFR